MLKKGDQAPEIKGVDANGNEVKPEDFSGKKKIVYFYPKDNTPGCTAESCNLRDYHPEFKKMGYEIIGISKDSAKSHKKFTDKYELPFTLIADTEKELIQGFGAWGRKKFMGKEYDGILRSTFILDENNKVEHVIDKVKTKSHSDQIMEIIKN